MSSYLFMMFGAVVLLAVAIKLNAEWIMNIVLRGVLGTIAMYFINQTLASVGISGMVGINAITILTSGILGFPGLLALYGIGLYKIL